MESSKPMETLDPKWILEHSLSFDELFKNHAKDSKSYKDQAIGRNPQTVAMVISTNQRGSLI